MNIYVGNLSLNVSKDDIESINEYLKEYGTVKHIEVVKGRSRGFGFVEMCGESETSIKASGRPYTKVKLDGKQVNTAWEKISNKKE